MHLMKHVGQVIAGRLRYLGAMSATALILAACSPPAIETMPLQPETKQHILVLNETIVVTFTNSSAANVTVAGGAFEKAQTTFTVVNNCIGVIAPRGTCTIRVTKVAEGNVNRWFYLGNANSAPQGGVILR